MSISALNWCIDQKDLPPGEWVVLFHLCHCHNHETGRCDPSQEYLAGMTNMGVRTVRRHISNLELKGRIARLKRGIEGGGRVSDYYVLGHEPAKLAATLTGQSMRTNRPIRAENVHEMAAKQGSNRERTGNTPKSPKENSPDLFSADTEHQTREVSTLSETSIAKKKKNAPSETLSEVTEILTQIVPLDVAQNFVGHRKDLKKPMTVRSAKMMAKELSGHHSPAAVLNASIVNGWQGIFPEKIKPANGGNYDKRRSEDPALANIARLAGLGGAPSDGGF